MKNKTPQATEETGDSRINPLVLEKFSDAVQDDKVWMSRYLNQCEDLPLDMRRALVPVAFNARYTTFVEDSGYSPDGMALSTLTRYTKTPESRFNLIVALKRLAHHTIGSELLAQYYREFEKKTGLIGLASRVA